MEEVDNSGNVVARYTQGPPIIDEPLSELRAGTTSYYEQDGVRTVTSLSNSSGGLANTYSYDSFGKLIASTGTLTNPFQYTGRQFDSETGVYYYRARYYDQGVGRFLSEDLLKGVSDSVNFYAYVQNNSTNLIDPSGLSPECACAPAKRLRLVPISDCHHGSSRRIVYELQGPGASNWWVTEHQNPTSWAPATPNSPAGQSTGDQNDGPGGFDDTIYGWAIGNSLQNFTISRQDPRKSPNTPSCPVNVALPSRPNGQNQDYRTLGIWHGNPIFINGNSTGWLPCNNSFEVPGYGQ
jgi:RHS repeat-associated protein